MQYVHPIPVAAVSTKTTYTVNDVVSNEANPVPRETLLAVRRMNRAARRALEKRLKRADPGYLARLRAMSKTR